MVPVEIIEHIQAIEHWIEGLGRIPGPRAGLTSEERKQLYAVNKAVDQLQRSSVPVPEDLRSLKLKLSAKDVTGSHDREAEVHLKSIEKIINTLGRTLKLARLVKDRLKLAGQGSGTKKHYGITLLDFIQAGVLSTDDRFELQWLKDGPVLNGKIKADGTVMVNTSKGWMSYPSLSTAASQAAGRSLNGWQHWRRINPDGTGASLVDIRVQYLNEEDR